MICLWFIHVLASPIAAARQAARAIGVFA